MSDAICPCGAVLEPSVRKPRKFCSKKCTRAFYYRRPPRTEEEKCSVDGCTRSRAAKGMCLAHRSTVHRQEQAAKGIKRNRFAYEVKQYAKTCAHCSTQFWTTTSATRHCQDCTRQQRWKSKRSRELMVYTGPPFVRKPKANKNPIPKTKRKFKCGLCKVCKSPFVTLYMDLTCSSDCQRKNLKATQKRASKGNPETRKAAADRRRARKLNAFVENVYRKKVFARDGYRCQVRLPGCKGVDMNKVVPHPKAPTLDHIIPLAAGVAAGGTHEPKNCHLACFHCNSKKSDGSFGEQLLLIG